MTILHVADSFLPKVGGIELHVRDLVRHQRAAGDDAHVVTLASAGPDDVDPRWVHRPATRPGVAAVGPRQAAHHLEEALAAPGVDAVHIHLSLLSPLAFAAGRRAALLGLPTVITVHSMWSGLGPVPVVARAALALRRWPAVWSAVSDRAAEPVRALLGREVHVLPNAVEPGEWWTGRPTYAEERPAGAPLTVISVMRLTRVKRTLPLARILRDVRRSVPELDLRAVVVGDGPQRAALHRRLRHDGLVDRVDLPGRLGRDEIRALLTRSAVFLAPAERESFGIAPLEARTLGLPVVASSHSGVGEFVTPGVNGLLGSDDRALARHVVALLRDDTLRTRIAAYNRLTPVTHDWEAARARASALYAEARDLVRASQLRVPSP